MSKSHRLVAGIFTLVLGASLAACSGGAGSGGAVATVNGDPISQADFDAKLQSSPMARQVLQQMVQEKLIEQYAAKNNIVVTSADVAAKEDTIKANFPAGSWDQMLKARGLTENDVQSAVRTQIIIDRAVGKNVNVTEAQIDEFFNKNHAGFDTPAKVCARHILVPDLATAQKVEAALKSGQKFEAVAAQYSTDPGTKAKGGDLGCFGRGQMVPAFDQAAFALTPGEISPPVRSPYGYHVIQVESRTPAQKATLASAHAKIADELRQQQEGPLVQPFLQSLMQSAKIQTNDPQFAGLFAAGQPGAAPQQ